MLQQAADVMFINQMAALHYISAVHYINISNTGVHCKGLHA